MKTLDGLPVRYYSIDDNDDFTGVEMVSAVDYPAIEVNWKAFSNTNKKYFAAEDRQIVTGPAMIPDLPIYRFDQEGEYWGVFTAETIEKIVKKFNRSQKTVNVNYMHQDDSQVKDAVIIEQWFITDKANDKSNALGFDLPVGTWMVSVHFADKDFWTKEVKSGNVRGFSIEGFLNMEMKKLINKDIIVDGQIIVDENMKTQIHNLIKTNKTNMSKLTFKVTAKTKDGVTISTPADAFAEGVEVFITDADGNDIQATEGDHTLEDGTIITVKEGKIVTMVAPTVVEETVVTETEQAAEVKYTITPEDIASIAEALGIADLIKRIEALESANTELKTENTAMKTLLSKVPGTDSSISDKDDTDATPRKQTFSDKVEAMRALKARK